MPGGDRTGPLGMGPLTGRQMGYCSGISNTGFYGRGFGAGRGHGLGFSGGFGRGFGFRNRNFFTSNIPDISDKNALENEISFLKEQLSALEEQVSKLDKKD